MKKIYFKPKITRITPTLQNQLNLIHEKWQELKKIVWSKFFGIGKIG